MDLTAHRDEFFSLLDQREGKPWRATMDLLRPYLARDKSLLDTREFVRFAERNYRNE
jgi:hypothetical protein